MSITRRADYAVRIMYELAQVPEAASLSLRDLCEAGDVPTSFAEPLVQFLVDAGMVRSAGYRGQLLSLALPASEISMADLIRTTDPTFSLSPCTVEPHSCARSPHCGVRRMWAELDDVVWQRLAAITLADVATGAAKNGGDTSRGTLFPGLLGTA